MDKYINYAINNANWKKGLVFSLIFASFYFLINFSSIGIAGLLQITGGPNILDLEFGYNNEKAYRILTDLGTNGREFHLNKIVPIDFFFPLSYMFFYAVWMGMLLKHLALNNWCKYSIFLPAFAMLCDWVENIGIIIMLKNYPNLPELAILNSSIAGMVKMISIILNWSIIAILFIVFLIKKHGKKLHNS